MHCRFLTVCFSVLLLAGCVTQRIPFPEEELAGLDRAGETVLTGKVFLIDQFEDEQVGEETGVVLEPLTSYCEQWYEVKYLQNKSLAEADPRYEKYLKRTITDQEGNFSISGVAPGEYLLTGTVFWKAVTCSANVVKTDVLISKKVTVQDGDQELEIPLTKEFQSPVDICNLYNQSSWDKGLY